MSDTDLSYSPRRLLRYRGKTCNLYKENPVVREEKPYKPPQ